MYIIKRNDKYFGGSVWTSFPSLAKHYRIEYASKLAKEFNAELIGPMS